MRGIRRIYSLKGRGFALMLLRWRSVQLRRLEGRAGLVRLSRLSLMRMLLWRIGFFLHRRRRGLFRCN
jgi:hypothetical protein